MAKFSLKSVDFSDIVNYPYYLRRTPTFRVCAEDKATHALVEMEYGRLGGSAGFVVEVARVKDGEVEMFFRRLKTTPF